MLALGAVHLLSLCGDAAQRVALVVVCQRHGDGRRPASGHAELDGFAVAVHAGVKACVQCTAPFNSGEREAGAAVGQARAAGCAMKTVGHTVHLTAPKKKMQRNYSRLISSGNSI